VQEKEKEERKWTKECRKDDVNSESGNYVMIEEEERERKSEVILVPKRSTVMWILKG